MEPEQRVLPTRITVQSLDLVNGCCGNATLRKTQKTVTKSRPFKAALNGERGQNAIIATGLIKRWFEEPDHQLPQDVIKGGTRVRNAVSDDSAQPERRLDEDVDRQRQSMQVAVGLAPNDLMRLFVQVHPNFGLESIQMFLSPDDFEPSTI
jgi:hypothetical protein